MNVQNGQQNEAIGDEHNQGSDRLSGPHKVEEQKLASVSVRARKSQETRDVTEDMSDFIRCSEGAAKCVHCEYRSMQVATNTGSNDRGHTDSGRHAHCIQEMGADCYLAFIYHCSKEKTLCRCTSNKEKHLCCTSTEPNGFVL